MPNPIIQKFSQFIDISEEEKKLIVEKTTIKELKAGDYLIKEGQIPSLVAFVITGVLRKYRVSKKHEHNDYFAIDGHFIVDYPKFLSGQPTKYYIQAIEDTSIIFFEKGIIDYLYAVSPKWNIVGRKMAEDVIDRLYMQIEIARMKKPKQRYEMFIEKYPEIFQRLPLYHIASYLGIEPQSLSRIRANY